MGWFKSKKPNYSKEITRIEEKVKSVTSDSRRINEGLVSIAATNKLMKVVEERFKNATHAKSKAMIDASPLQDQEYKNKIKAVIDQVKQQGIDAIVPLCEDSYKIELGMIAGSVKAKTHLLLLETQKKVASSGKIHLEVLAHIEKETDQNAKEIKKLLHNMEEVNGMVESTLISYNQSSREIEDLISGGIENVGKADTGFAKVLQDFAEPPETFEAETVEIKEVA